MPVPTDAPANATFPPASLADAVLAQLAAHPEGVSLPRLCKRLQVRMSVLLRALAWLGETRIGVETGAGWVRVERRGELDVAVLTVAGRVSQKSQN